MAHGISGSVLLLGHEGMLGRACEALFKAQSVEYATGGLPEFDITDQRSVNALLRPEFKTVVNCTAWTDVDGAEDQEERAAEVNGHGVGYLAARCAELGSLLVHYSTDYVFSGVATSPYRVDATLDPQNAYGRTKALGERLLKDAGCAHLLVRTSWLYAPWANNFVRTMLRLGKEREVLKVVSDQRGRPTSAEHLARTTLALLVHGAQGTFHVTDGGECSWYEFAQEIMTQAGLSARVEACSTAEFPRPAKRPRYSVLDLSRTEALVGPCPDWRLNLRDVLQQLAT